MDIRLGLMTGIDIPVPECQIILHQPTIEEISFLGEEDFFIGAQTLSLNKSMFIEDKTALEKISNFQVFMTVMNDKSTRDKRDKAQSIFSLLGFNKVMFTPRSLILTDFQNESHVIDNENFDAFQQTFKQIICANNGPMDQQSFNPANEAAKAIADKLMRGRQRVAAQKGSSTSSVFSKYLSILSIALKIPISELKKNTMYQLYDMMDRYVLYTSWDLDIRTRLAGGKPDSHPDDWMKDIH